MLEVKRIFIGIQPVCQSPLASGKTALDTPIVCAAAPLTVKIKDAAPEVKELMLQETPLIFPETDV